MAVIGALLILVALLGLLLGLIKPSLVIWRGKVRSRGRVLAIYGLALVAGIILSAFGAPTNLEAAKAAISNGSYDEAVKRLEAVATSNDDYAEAQQLLPGVRKKSLMLKLETAEAASLSGDHTKVVGLLADYPSGAPGSIDAEKILAESKDALARQKEASENDQVAVAEIDNSSEGEALNEHSPEKSRLSSVFEKLESLATDSAWYFAREESPFDGTILQAERVFESDEYTAQIAVKLKCVADNQLLTLTFTSYVGGIEGETLPSSAFDTFDLGPLSAAAGRVKWAGRETERFMVLLTDNSNVAVMRPTDIFEAAKTPNGSVGEAMNSLLPAHIGLSNGAGEFILSVPKNDPNVQKVLEACSRSGRA